MAAALGITALGASDAAGLKRVAALLAEGVTEPVLVDFRVTDAVRAAWLEEAFERGTH